MKAVKLFGEKTDFLHLRIKPDLKLRLKKLRVNFTDTITAYLEELANELEGSKKKLKK